MNETEGRKSAWNPCSNCHTDSSGNLMQVCDDCWGSYCKHGHKIMQVVAETRGKGDGRQGEIVEPWPCNEGCTRDSFEAALYEEAAYWDSQGPLW